MDSGLSFSGSPTPKNFFWSKIVSGLVIMFAILGMISLIIVITNYLGVLPLFSLINNSKNFPLDLTNPAVIRVRVDMETNLNRINRTPEWLELVTDLQDQGMPSFILSEKANLSFALKSDRSKDLASASATDLQTGQRVFISISYFPGSKQLEVERVRILE